MIGVVAAAVVAAAVTALALGTTGGTAPEKTAATAVPPPSPDRGERDPIDAVEIPGGPPFWRGHPHDAQPHPYGNPDTHPLREITVGAFRIDRTEVTVGRYDRCVSAGVCAPRACRDASEAVPPERPAACVRWEDSVAFCAWAGGRLPTEAEWEKAARSIDGRPYPWGKGAPTCDVAVFAECGIDGPLPAGDRAAGASPYGVLDMAGNVSEWVADWYDPGYYAASPAENPKGPDSGSTRVTRGGSFATGSRLLMTGYREQADPLAARPDLGFRCAYPPDSP
jgi:formylglycine-generating enzyme required for sulfatase activity